MSQKKSHVTSMAGTSAVHSSLLLSLTAELERVARLCMLPSGWTCSPSLRLTPKGASLLVHWSPSPAAGKQDKGGKTKRRKRSAASQQRSAERAALHKARKATVASRQLNPAAAPFVQVPVPPTPNSVPAAGVPAAEESERVGGVMEAASKRAKKDGSGAVAQSPQPGPGPALRPWPKTKEEWQRLVDESGQLLVEAWERGEEGDHLFDAKCRTLDSLAGEGYAAKLIQDCVSRVRQDRAGS
jgi:hypothetical protein